MTKPDVSTCFWFDHRALEAATLYTSLFSDGEVTEVFHKDGDPAQGAFTVHFRLMGQHFWGLNGGPHFKPTPAASIAVSVDTQAEVDHLWTSLLAGGGAESRCGWLTDYYGISWQIIPRALPRLLKQDASGRVMRAMMDMIKFDIAALEAAARSS